MSCIVPLLGFLALGLLVGPWIVAGLGYRRQRLASARIDALERELARLGGRLEQVLARRGAVSEPGAFVAEKVAAAAPEEASVAVAATLGLGGEIAGAAAVTPAFEIAPPPSAADPLAAAVGMPPATAHPPVASAAAAAAPPPPPSAPPGAGDGGAASAAPPGGPGGASPSIDWERWIGVRGAAVLGGVVLALAGIYLVRYTIERGLLSPAVRVSLGVLAGVASIAWSERLRRRGYRINADALAGAGIVLLYAAVWAAHALYGFVGAGACYGLMSLVTVACGVLSWRHGSLLIAVLGLVGGFATPLLLSSGSDNPIGLFGYVLLLDLGLLALARRRGWSVLLLLALGGTLFYQAAWILTRMRAGSALLGLAILGVFALLFGLAGVWRERRDGAAPAAGWLVAEALGLLTPFAFALYFAGRADLGPHLYPVAALLLLLSLAAQRLARRPGRDGLAGADLLASGAAAGSLAVVLVWGWDVTWTPALAWEAVAICVVLSAAFHVFHELDLRATLREGATTRREDATADGENASTDRGGAITHGLSIVVAEIGFLVLLVAMGISSAASPWPWVLGWLTAGALVVRLSTDPARSFTPLVAAAAVGVGFAGWFLAARGTPGMPPAPLWFGAVLLVGAGFQLLALRRRPGEARRMSEIGAAVYPAIVLVGLAMSTAAPAIGATTFLPVSVLLALLSVLATTRLGSGVGYGAAMALVTFTHSAWSVTPAARAAPLAALLVFGACAAGFALWPSWAPRLARSPAAWRAAALAAPLWFWAMRALFVERFGDRAIGILPLALAAVTLAAAYRGRRAWAGDPETARTAHLAWFGAVALGFAAIAVPLQLEKEWITVGWALEGLAVVALWRRLDHAGLKYFGAALFAAVAARLLLNPQVLTYHLRGGWPVVNWLAYTYLVPAACLLGAARILGKPTAPREPRQEAAAAAAEGIALPLEAARARSWEAVLYARRLPVVAGAFGLAAILVVFAWINLTIFDAFSTGPRIALSLDRLPARDLTLSLAWVAYAVILLAIGMARNSTVRRPRREEDAGGGRGSDHGRSLRRPRREEDAGGGRGSDHGRSLRWLSLGFLVLSIGKVFLYDLGELRDLYRVASLVGLAMTLILVSLAYQRFVFRSRSEDPAS